MKTKWGRKPWRVGVCALTGIAAAGCSTRATQARTPMLAFVAPGPPPFCAVEGRPRVLATRVSALGGLDALAEGRSVRLRFARSAGGGSGVALEVDPESLEVLRSETTEALTLPRGSMHETLDGLRSDVVAVQVGAHASVAAWTEGSFESGLAVHLQTRGVDGAAIGAPHELAYEGSAIGLPAVALPASGRGVVAFIESGGDRFQVVAASLDCRGVSSGSAPAGGPEGLASR